MATTKHKKETVQVQISRSFEGSSIVRGEIHTTRSSLDTKLASVMTTVTTIVQIIEETKAEIPEGLVELAIKVLGLGYVFLAEHPRLMCDPNVRDAAALTSDLDRELNAIKIGVRKIADNRAKPTGGLSRVFGGTKAEEKAILKKSSETIQYYLGRMGFSSTTDLHELVEQSVQTVSNRKKTGPPIPFPEPEPIEETMQVDLQPPSPRRRQIEPPREPSAFPLPPSPAPRRWRDPSPIVQDESEEEGQEDDEDEDEDEDEAMKSPGLLNLPVRKHGKTKSVGSFASSRSSSRSGQESFTSEPAPTRNNQQRREWESRPRRETRDDFDNEPPRRSEPSRPQHRGPNPSGPQRRPRGDYDHRDSYYDDEEDDNPSGSYWRGTGYQHSRSYPTQRLPIRPPLIPSIPSGFSGVMSIGSNNTVGNNLQNVGNITYYIDHNGNERRSR